MTQAGVRVGLDESGGLPAYFRGVRIIAETCAGFPITAFRGFDEDRHPEPTAPQLAVVRNPNPDMTSFQLRSYVIAGMINNGNGYLWKVKDAKGNVAGFYPIDPRLVRPKYKEGSTTFEIRDKEFGEIKQIVGPETVLHIPGILWNHPHIGVSVIEMLRNPLGTYLARQEFEGRYFANDGQPGIILRNDQNVPEQQRNQIRDSWEAKHVGPTNAGRPALIWGGWTLEKLGITLTDAQFVESQLYSVKEIARMLGVPSGMLDAPSVTHSSQTVEQENMRFLQFGLDPWMRRFEQGLTRDTDFFPDPEVTLSHDASDLLRADIQTRYDAFRLARQAGWLTPNEIRRQEGYTDSTDPSADVLQATPVGGAPNPPSNANAAAKQENVGGDNPT